MGEEAQIHLYNANLPFSKAQFAQFVESGKLLLAGIFEEFDKLEKTGCAAKLLETIRHVNYFLNLKHALSKEDLIKLIDISVRIAHTPWIYIRDQVRVAKLLRRLLEKFKRRFPKDRKDLVGRYSWRPFFTSLMQMQFPEEDVSEYYSGKLLQAHASAVGNAVMAIRKYFTAEMAREIHAECMPYICSFSNVKTAVYCHMLCLFMPTTPLGGHNIWLEDVMGVWKWMQRSRWDSNLVHLVSRLARDQLGLVDWTSHIDEIYASCVWALELPTSLSATAGEVRPRSSGSGTSSIANENTLNQFHFFARIIAFTLQGGRGHPTFQALERMMRTIQLYCHPSNPNTNANGLKRCQLVQSLCEHVVKRCYKEDMPGAALVSGIEAWAVNDGGVTAPHRLSQEARVHFCEIMLPVVHYLLQGRHSIVRKWAQNALRHLASLSAQTCLPKFLEEACGALENLVETHTTQSALETLSGVVPHLLDEELMPTGREALGQIIFLALPGIDSNDKAKTTATLKFFDSLFVYWVDAPRDLGLLFADFAHAYMDRVITFIGNIGDVKQGKGNATLSMCTRHIFLLMEDDLFKDILAKAIHFINTTMNVAAKEDVGNLIGALVQREPAETLKRLFVPMYDSLVHPARDSEKEEFVKGDVSLVEQKWYLHHLGVLAECPPHVLASFVDRYLRIVRIYSQDVKEKDVHELAQTLLTEVIVALSSPAPKWRESWSSRLDPQGTDCGLRWEEPLDEFISKALDIMDEFLVGSLDSLNDMIPSISANRGALPESVRIEVLSHLFNVKAAFSGGAHLIGEMSNVIAEDALPGLNSLWHGHPRMKQVRDRVAETLDALYDVLLDEPTGLVDVFLAVIRVLKHVLSDRGASSSLMEKKHKNTKLSMAVIHLRHPEKYHSDAGQTTRASFKLNTVGSKLLHYPFPSILGRVSIHIGIVKSSNSLRPPLCENHLRLFKMIQRLSVHPYQVVRENAQSVVQSNLHRYPFEYKRLLVFFVDKMKESPNIPKEHLKGCVHTLGSSIAMRRIWDNWDFMANVTRAIAKAAVFKEEKVVNNVLNLFVSLSAGLSPHMSHNAKKLINQDSSVDPLAAHLAELAKVDNEAIENTVRDLILRAREGRKAAPDTEGEDIDQKPTLVMAVTQMSPLVVPQPSASLPKLPSLLPEPLLSDDSCPPSEGAGLSEGQPGLSEGQSGLSEGQPGEEDAKTATPSKEHEVALHWKYELVNIAMCSCLQGYNRDVVPVVVFPWFLKNLVEASLPTCRRLSMVACFSGLLAALDDQKARNPPQTNTFSREAVLEMCSRPLPTTAEEYDKCEFFDKIWFGWNKGASMSIPEFDLSYESETLRKLRDIVLDYFTETKMAKFLEALEDSIIYGTQEAGAVKEKGEIIAGHLGYAFTEGFNTVHARLFSGLFICCGRGLWLKTKGPLESYSSKEMDREKACVVAAVITGLLRASTYWTFDDQVATWNEVQPILHRAISTTTNNPDILRTQRGMASLVVLSRDPRRSLPFIELIMSLLDDSVERPAIDLTKVISLLCTIFREIGWKGKHLALRALEKLKPMVSHTYYQVRVEVAQTVVEVFAACGDMSDMTTTVLQLNEFLNDLVEGLEKYAPIWKDGGTCSGDQCMVKDVRTFGFLAVFVLGMVKNYGLHHAIMPYVTKLIPHLFYVTASKDQDCPCGCGPLSFQDTREVARVGILCLSHAIFPETSFGGLLECLESISKWVLQQCTKALFLTFHIRQASWRTKMMILNMVQGFLCNHIAVMKVAIELQWLKVIESFLADSNGEVRDLAIRVLGNILNRCSAEVLEIVTSKAIARLAPIGRKRGDIPMELREAVLSLAGMIISCPFTVPAWMPKAIVLLNRFGGDSYVKPIKKKVVTEFWRSHRDAWHIHKQVFNEEELEALEDCQEAPHYYA